MISVRLDTLTPLHIGSGRELSRNVEFVEMNNEIGVIDEEKILKLIGEENIPIWISIIEKQELLIDYLKKRKPDLKLQDFCKYTMPLFAKNFRKVRSLKEHLHDGRGKPYIPGSSIKGAIRTAILNTLQYESNKEWLDDEIITVHRRSGREIISDKKIQEFFFGENQNKDFMRFIKTGDAYFNNSNLVALSVLSLNYLFDDTKRDEDYLQLTEAIKAESSADFKMKLDLDLWQKNIDYNHIANSIPDFSQDLQSLFKALNYFTSSLLQNEINFWEEDINITHVEDYIEQCSNLLKICKQCKENEAVLRLGHGSGWLFMTGGWIKNSDFINDEGRDNLYDKIIDKARPRNYKYREYFFPKTRRMNENGELLGFIKLSF